MVLLAQELLTRLIPLSPAEAFYARNRLQEERCPTPEVGDQVYFRRNQWDVDEDLHLMRVIEVQDPNDTTSDFATNLCQHLRDTLSGKPLFFTDGTPVIVPLPDPWPWIKMIWDGSIDKSANETWKYRPQVTFESRMRGSPGWLPRDYTKRRVIYVSGDIPKVQLPAYRFNGERIEVERGDGNWLPYRQK